jgi:hypothetical protein
MAGAILGGIGSGATSAFLSQQPDKLNIKGIPFGGKQLVAGPVKNLSFAFVILGRAVAYVQALMERTHANRSVLDLDGVNDEDWLSCLDKAEQVKLSYLLQKSAKSLKTSERTTLENLVLRLM